MRLLATIFVALLLAGCIPSDDKTYTLYRDPAVGTARVHMATFDADEREGYNEGNCRLTAKLYQDKVGPSVRYWCEKGRFRP